MRHPAKGFPLEGRPGPEGQGRSAPARRPRSRSQAAEASPEGGAPQRDEGRVNGGAEGAFSERSRQRAKPAVSRALPGERGEFAGDAASSRFGSKEGAALQVRRRSRRSWLLFLPSVSAAPFGTPIYRTVCRAATPRPAPPQLAALCCRRARGLGLTGQAGAWRQLAGWHGDRLVNWQAGRRAFCWHNRSSRLAFLPPSGGHYLFQKRTPGAGGRRPKRSLATRLSIQQETTGSIEHLRLGHIPRNEVVIS